ncbi:MAG: tetratricopeptide repeat protein [Dysgonamonadaceae bacterium]|jgi:tetratricopeptide (TPR) repeat protein|nr:tetratricopeptide repeat protein [Dysgonamonadaceae bacterium]
MNKSDFLCKSYHTKAKEMKFPRKILTVLLLIASLSIADNSQAQINTSRMLTIGRNALYFEDYILSIQYFNEVVKAKPYLAEPYLYRALAKLNLDDFRGAEKDLTLCIERNPFLVYAYLYRGIARQSTGEYLAAIADYDKGLEYRPEDKQMLINKGIAYVQHKDYDSAVITLDLLLKYHPKFTQGYITRSSVYAEKGDTVQAVADIEKSLSLDKFYAPAYGQRAIIYLQQAKYGDAEKDLNEAIRLEPKQIAYYINRGLTRYYLDNLRGAMDDYDAVMTLNPENTVARFNRGLLRAQVGDASRAIEDFNIVIQNEPDNLMAVYNRAILNEESGKYADAVKDLNTVLEVYPNFVSGYYFKSDVERKMKDMKAADTDYWYAYDLEQRLQKEKEKGKIVTGQGVFDTQEEADNNGGTADDDRKTRKQSDKSIEKFSRLVVYDREEEEIKSAYNNEIRGRVQDRNVRVDLQPQFVITYYEKTGDLDQTLNHYSKLLSEYNAGSSLKMQLRAANREAALTDGQAEYHFRSIDEYSLAIDRNHGDIDAYFGRALDFMVVHDLTEAIEDYTRVTALDPDFVFAYFNRAVVRYKKIEIETSGNADENNMTLNIQRRTVQQNINPYSKNIGNPVQANQPLTAPAENSNAYELEQILRDYNACIQINPDFVYAWYNRGNIHCARKDFRAAISDYSEAIERNPYFAEAWYNRGLSYLSLGEADRGTADLSRAGELGLAEAYSIIKKMRTE